jgi:hypothetical protein
MQATAPTEQRYMLSIPTISVCLSTTTTWQNKFVIAEKTKKA